jgi:hypothetical protein
MPKLTIYHRQHCFLSAILFFTAIVTHSQGRHLDITRSSTIDVVTKEEITQLGIGNMTEILRFAPNTHHLNSRVTTYDFDDPLIDKRTDKIFYDGKNQLAYVQAVTTNVSGETIAALEQVWKDKNLVQGYQWSNTSSNKYAYLYDEPTNKYLPQTFELNWQPKFIYIPPSPADIVDFDAAEYIRGLTNERAQVTGPSIMPDETYSSNGKSEINRRLEGTTRIKEEKIFDARGVLREYRYREVYPDDFVYEEITYYNCAGERIYFESTMYDDEDYEVELIDIIYKDGKPAGGIRDVDDYDEEGAIRFRQYYNPVSQRFEPRLMMDWEYDDYLFDLNEQRGPCDYPDYFSFGPRLILEDSYPERFSTIGGYASYTHMFGKHWGITGDLGLTVGSQFDNDYTKLNIMAGPTFFPCDHASFDDPFSVNAHLYVGLSSITSKYSNMGTDYKNSENYFTGLIGIDGFYNLNSKLSIKVGANYNLNFTEGNTSKNYLFDAGLAFRF